MKAFVINNIYDLTSETQPLEQVELPIPILADNEILIKVSSCGVCHTELDEIEGRSPPPLYPVVPGHQVVGCIEKCGSKARLFKEGDRVGVAWIYSCCEQCEYCTSGRENLCVDFMATGRDANGGYAEWMKAPETSVYPIPPVFSDTEAAPLLCAGAIGYRSLRLSGLQNGQTLGLTGFGASGHLVLKLARYLMPDSKILVFARSIEEQAFARSLGATWVGDAAGKPPLQANCIIDTTPAWNPLVQSLLQLKPGGRLVINAIRKEIGDQEKLLEMRYKDHLWMEKEIKSVANITRNDVREFLTLAAKIPLMPKVEVYTFDRANQALIDLKKKNVEGAKVLVWQ